ncbi:hypothetical protein BLNAU_395 [Blattamonas nauphoetae]|uniref:Uncharacterized protein n=1 Tax=Blattamonas nauphoetae TaxID=2049346 RepID=A0ABQ9YL54_9EUKA|nr:hypothetical protein BLNAU_395 [Blattamonas nauphoetae]
MDQLNYSLETCVSGPLFREYNRQEHFDNDHEFDTLSEPDLRLPLTLRRSQRKKMHLEGRFSSLSQTSLPIEHISVQDALAGLSSENSDTFSFSVRALRHFSEKTQYLQELVTQNGIEIIFQCLCNQQTTSDIIRLLEILHRISSDRTEFVRPLLEEAIILKLLDFTRSTNNLIQEHSWGSLSNIADQFYDSTDYLMRFDFLQIIEEYWSRLDYKIVWSKSHTRRLMYDYSVSSSPICFTLQLFSTAIPQTQEELSQNALRHLGRFLAGYNQLLVRNTISVIHDISCKNPTLRSILISRQIDFIIEHGTVQTKSVPEYLVLLESECFIDLSKYLNYCEVLSLLRQRERIFQMRSREQVQLCTTNASACYLSVADSIDSLLHELSLIFKTFALFCRQENLFSEILLPTGILQKTGATLLLIEFGTGPIHRQSYETERNLRQQYVSNTLPAEWQHYFELIHPKDDQKDVTEDEITKDKQFLNSLKYVEDPFLAKYTHSEEFFSLTVNCLFFLSNVVAGTADETQAALDLTFSSSDNPQQAFIRNMLVISRWPSISIQLEVAWVFHGFLGGTEEQLRFLIQNNVLPVLFTLFTDDHLKKLRFGQLLSDLTLVLVQFWVKWHVLHPSPDDALVNLPQQLSEVNSIDILNRYRNLQSQKTRRKAEAAIATIQQSHSHITQDPGNKPP